MGLPVLAMFFQLEKMEDTAISACMISCKFFETLWITLPEAFLPLSGTEGDFGP